MAYKFLGDALVKLGGEAMKPKCTCHAGKKCAYCMMREGLLQHG